MWQATGILFSLRGPPGENKYNFTVDSTLENLLERVSAAARRLPRATELVLFGSAADPALADIYSDLDLQLLTGDFALSRTTWDIITLDRRLPEAVRLDLLGLVDCLTPPAMDAALVALSRRIAEIVLSGCGPSDAPTEALVHQYLAFIESELASQL